MKTLYLECNMGAAGDMLMGALLELIPDRESFLKEMNALGLPGVQVRAEKAVKCGVTGTHMRVIIDGREELSRDLAEGHAHHHHHDHEHDHDHDHEHDHGHEHAHAHEHEHTHVHAHLGDIEALIDGLPLSLQVREHAKAVYALLAQAEGQVHGRPVADVHFHEVGTMDAVADVVGVCLLMEKIGAEAILASPVHVGSGSVQCMHGVLPVPAPATALILEGIPTYGGQVQGELCTPTGAALLKHFVDRFGDRPLMTTSRIGYGMGQKDFPRMNGVRAFLGESESETETVCKLECNLDDMTGEKIGYAMERLLDAGALDVYTVPCGMKKSRPGVILCCLCPTEEADKFAALIMKHTTTLGIRRQECSRYRLERWTETVALDGESVRVKYAKGMGVARCKPEYDDVSRIARNRDVSLQEVETALFARLSEKTP